MSFNLNEKKADIICNDMRHLGNSYEFDCKFIVGRDPSKVETVYGCKWVLAMESPVFEKMLLGDFQEAKDPSKGIVLPDDDPKALRHFRLLACCNDRTSRMNALNLEDTLSLTEFCEKYMALSITKLCTDRLLDLCDTAKPGDLIKMFEVTRDIEDTLVYDKVKMTLNDLGYPLEDTVYDINQEAFKEYIVKCCDNAHPGTITYNLLFAAIERYVKHNNLIPANLLDCEENAKEKLHEAIGDDACDESPAKAKPEDDDPADLPLQTEKMQRQYLRSLLKLIDFAGMETVEFISGPGASKILTVEQKYHILSCICNEMESIVLFEI